MSESKNDTAWNSLFQIYDIVEKISNKGQFVISSDLINKVREARLMTKFDHHFQLPQIFVDNDLSILPISRGDYVIAPINTFYKIEENENLAINDFAIPEYVRSLEYENITSEAMAISCAYVSGIIQDFTEDERLVPTVNGRMSSLAFDFTVAQKKSDQRLNVKVNNSQIEIDGGYEGINTLNLIEAKNNISSDFLIRQLYYPYRLWKNKVDKIVCPIFMTYTNGVFDLRRYEFTELGFYNSIQLVKEKKYRIKSSADEAVINTQTIMDLMKEVKIVGEPTNVPFPQADSFKRIINLCEIIYNESGRIISKEDLSSNYDFTEKDSFELRQVDYYTNAAIYLGLIEKCKSEEGNISYKLTSVGSDLFGMPFSKRQLCYAEQILKHGVFKKSLECYFKKAEVPSKEEIVQIMKTSNLNRVNEDTTFRRRSSTVISWINWIVSLIEE